MRILILILIFIRLLVLILSRLLILILIAIAHDVYIRKSRSSDDSKSRTDESGETLCGHCPFGRATQHRTGPERRNNAAPTLPPKFKERLQKFSKILAFVSSGADDDTSPPVGDSCPGSFSASIPESL